MSSTYPTSMLDPRTLASIECQRPGRPGTIHDPYPCGCHPRTPDRWYICDYHDGYDSALDIHASFTK